MEDSKFCNKAIKILKIIVKEVKNMKKHDKKEISKAKKDLNQ